MDEFHKIRVLAEYQLPASFAREIGRIMVQWAFFEHCIQRTIWALVGVDETTGRLSVRDPRMDDRINMIRELAELKSVKLDQTMLVALSKDAEIALTKRDLYAHGLWSIYPNGTWCVRQLRGQHPKGRKGVSHRSRRIAPEAVLVYLKGLHTVAISIEKLIVRAVALETTVNQQLQASLKKPA